MSGFTPFMPNSLLRAAELNTAFGFFLPTTGGQLQGAAEFNGIGTFAVGPSAGNQGSIHVYSTTPGVNYTPMLLEYYLETDRRVTGGDPALSTIVSVSSFMDPVSGTPGLQYNTNLHAYSCTVACSAANVPVLGGGDNNGFTNVAYEFTSGRPTQYASDAAATAAYQAQSVKAALTPPTLENFYSTTDTADFVYLPASILGTLAAAENDMQVNCEDDTGSRNGIALIVDQKQRITSGGWPASISAAFYANAIAGAFIGIGYETGDDVLFSFDSRQTVQSFQAAVTTVQNVLSCYAAAGSALPGAAPTPPSGGSVVHIDSYRSPTITSATPGAPTTTLTMSDVTGMGVVFPTNTPVSSGTPNPVYINNHAYEVIAWRAVEELLARQPNQGETPT